MVAEADKPTWDILQIVTFNAYDKVRKGSKTGDDQQTDQDIMSRIDDD